MKLFYVLIIIHIFFSLQQSPLQSQNKFPDIFKNNKEEVKIQIDPNDMKDIDLNYAISSISKLFNDEIFNISMEINNLINNTLIINSELSTNTESEKIEIKQMLNELDKLKKRYKRNIIFSYAIGSIILVTFFIIFCYDSINNKKRKYIRGYKNPSLTKNENNQLDID